MAEAGPSEQHRALTPAPDAEVGDRLADEPALSFDSLSPPETARKAERVGEAKATAETLSVFALAVLAGAFIAMGAVFATTVTAGGGDVLGFGLNRLLEDLRSVLGGLAFTLGLILVVVAGAELFTGNNLVAIGWASRRVTIRALLRNWSIVFVGNFVGALATAALMFATEQHTLGGGAVGDQALAIAEAKLGYSFGQAVALGAFCNALVCLAVWLTFSARTTTDKILAVIPPIAAFVAAGFEHSVANMYFIPIALLIKTDGDFAAGGAADLSDLTWGSFFADNLVPVTIGNIIGGSLMVAAVYWVIYLRKSTSET